ncbi:hypothetical protein JZ751_016183 [Albula glossodonta]|uniref:Uncharacterized protein n=1 Tax=Albula glossodonta TaxID=121402 RepID=A0A8T2MXX8_9TELE|nr:hypothetical protein JZ751_016183 [Albula glossodonta]
MQLDPHPRLHLQEVHVEVHPHRLVDGVQEQVLCVAFQQRGFSHRGVPKHDNPELVLPQAGPAHWRSGRVGQPGSREEGEQEPGERSGSPAERNSRDLQFGHMPTGADIAMVTSSTSPALPQSSERPTQNSMPYG